MSVRPLLARLSDAQFIRFCIIGGVGFVTDAAVLMALIHGMAASAIAARFVSFACAVLVTFELNRRWTFRDAGARGYLSRLAAYLGVQSIGFACNLLVYTCLYLALRPLSGAPIMALAVASVAALFVNYFGARRLVFGQKPAADGFADP